MPWSLWCRTWGIAAHSKGYPADAESVRRNSGRHSRHRDRRQNPRPGHHRRVDLFPCPCLFLGLVRSDRFRLLSASFFTSVLLLSSHPFLNQDACRHDGVSVSSMLFRDGMSRMDLNNLLKRWKSWPRARSWAGELGVGLLGRNAMERSGNVFVRPRLRSRANSVSFLADQGP
jgi:hypothetical protein